ncbi:ABC transporter substrate-binding protein [Gordonia sp. HNM0687]|uniref:ABC transporter substrate-binding protein n=1 Tax=Gordonia mangrovi TaxID=2665643 RepID=A0A6L7GRN7_9ACTN|nr:ABC transporter substrate-binding protein [Gordonia mangrovi]MXP22272.1 ABC transporter substrate-binding protein [Gordonia mangrovi]UVF80878.1 ABC transporter substrate-binding protein [Gordonia mangrovi]
MSTCVAVLLLLTAVVTACGDDGPPTIDYVLDARIDTYNANTVDGNAAGVLMATTRMLPGFSYLGAQGQVTPDRDIGTVTPVPGTGLTLRYDFSPAAGFSDETALDCDDLVLAWAAMSGRFPGFRPATTAGYRDIETVDCDLGSRTATARFAQGRDYRDWLSLFGAGTMLPAHVVARLAGVGDVVRPIRDGDRAAIAEIADAWNTGFDLTPGPVDPARFPASGPYRIQEYSQSGGLELVSNESWWGDAPATSRVVLWGRGTDAERRLSEGAFDVADVSSGIVAGDVVASGSEEARLPIPKPNRALAVEELVLAQRGVFAELPARRAFASCLPRDGLAREFGQGAQIWNLRVLAPADNLAGQLNGAFGRAYARPNLPRARTLSADASGDAPMTVRIGYLAPMQRRAQMVAAIAESCRQVGIEVVDAGSPDITPAALADDVDALIVANGASFAAAGAANPSRDAFALRGGDPLNINNYRNPRVSGAIDRLVASDLAADRLDLVRTIENTAWATLPSIPLFAAPRMQVLGPRVDNVVSGLGRNGTGWNMDRWTVRD